VGLADEIATVSPLHDLGKVAIPDHILHKPGGLNAEEWEIMKTHTTIGGRLIKEIYDRTGSFYLWLAYEIAMFHHEKWAGGGYPTGISGDEIPVSARIMAIADVYDAMTSERSYKNAFSHEKTKETIMNQKGKQFDPRLTDAFVREEDAFIAIKKKYKD
jgi:putative two-component system response regulator